MLRKISHLILLTAALVASAARPGQASSLIYTATIPAQTAPFVTNFTLPQFDASLGTLTGITLSVTADSANVIQIGNLNAAPEPFTNATAALPLLLTGPTGTLVTATPVAGPIDGVANPGLNNFGGLSSTDAATLTVPSSAFASYTGTGSSTAQFTATVGAGTYSGTGNPGVLFGGSAVVSGAATLTYIFISAAAPEPGSMALVAFGLLPGFALLRRRA